MTSHMMNKLIEKTPTVHWNKEKARWGHLRDLVFPELIKEGSAIDMPIL